MKRIKHLCADSEVTRNMFVRFDLEDGGRVHIPPDQIARMWNEEQARREVATVTVLMPELPACAAIQFPDNTTFAGKRHHDCLSMINYSFGTAPPFGKGEWTQGFMTTKGRFVDRREAFRMMQDNDIPGLWVAPNGAYYLVPFQAWKAMNGILLTEGPFGDARP